MEVWSLFIKLLKISTFFLSSARIIVGKDGVLSDDSELNLPIRLNNPDGSEIFVNLTFSPNNRRLEFVVADFCERHNIRSFYCRKLFETAIHLRSQHFESLQKLNKVYFDRSPDVRDLSFVEETEEKVRDKSTSIKARQSSSSLFHGVPNPHLSRSPAAIQAELLHSTERREWAAIMENDEQHAFERVKESYDEVVSSLGARLSRVVVIHSCALPNQDSRVLEKLLRRIEESGVLSSWSQGIIYVFHYGENLAPELTDHFVRRMAVIFIHVSKMTNFFEIPTLRILSSLAKYSVTTHRSALPPSYPHVLYLHTKGVSYQQVHPQIEDWVDMMLHFLVDRHASSFHLLESGEFDAVGCNYCSHPYRMFSGNYWWTSLTFLASLPRLSLEDSNKYDAEKWLFILPSDRHKVRVYIPHTSNVYHASSRYPAFCYRSVPIPPSFEEFREVCGEDNREEYGTLHLSSSPVSRSLAEEDVTRNHFPSSARCNSLELYGNQRRVA